MVVAFSCWAPVVPEIAHPPSTAVSKSGGRWAALTGRPKLRSTDSGDAAADAFPLPGARGSRNRASAIDRRIKVGRPTGGSYWAGRTTVGRFGQRGGRWVFATGRQRGPEIAGPPSTAVPKSGGRPRRPPYQSRAIDGPRLLGGRNFDRSIRTTRRSVRFTYIGPGRSGNRASAIDRRIKVGRSMGRSYWATKTSVGRFGQRGGRCVFSYRG